MSKNGSIKYSFKNAVSGIVCAVKRERNFRIMMVATIIVLIFAFYLRVSLLETTILVWAIFAVFAVEMINTAIESVVDLVKEDWHEKARLAKDISAGMVLLAVSASVAVGMLIFVPRLILLFVE